MRNFNKREEFVSKLNRKVQRRLSLFRMLALAHDHLNKGLCIGTNFNCLPPDPFGRPVFAEPVMGGHMIAMGGMLAVSR